MRRGFLPLFILLLLIAGAVAGVLAYAAPDTPLDWETGAAPDLAGKIKTMIAERTPATTITEEELTSLILPSLYENRRIGDQAEITGADIDLEGDTLIVRTDVLVNGRFRLQLTHRLHLSWEKPDVVATHLSSSLKEIPIPPALFTIGAVRVPLRLPEGLPAEIEDVAFTGDDIRLKFRLSNPF